MAGPIPAICFVRRLRSRPRFVAAGCRVIGADRAQNSRGRPVNSTERLGQRGAVAAIEVDVIARRIGNVESDRLYGLETVTTRDFNVFGPRQDPSSPYSGVI